MTKAVYEAPAIDVVAVECGDVITTSILLPPAKFRSTKDSSGSDNEIF